MEKKGENNKITNSLLKTTTFYLYIASYTLLLLADICSQLTTIINLNLINHNVHQPREKNINNINFFRWIHAIFFQPLIHRRRVNFSHKNSNLIAFRSQNVALVIYKRQVVVYCVNFYLLVSTYEIVETKNILSFEKSKRQNEKQ